MTDTPQDFLNEQPAYKHRYQNTEAKNIAKDRYTIQKKHSHPPNAPSSNKTQDPIMQIIKVQIMAQSCPDDPVIPIMPSISGLQRSDKNSLEM
jgi:hypothetical protein